MEKANLTKEDIRDLIIYGLNENNIDVNSIEPKRIDMVIEDYLLYCNDFKSKYIKGELDTFKKAACLLVSINKNKLAFNKRLNACIAIDASQKMCEKPYWNVGPNADVPYKMEEVDFKNLFENDKYCYDKHRSMLTDALVYDDGVTPISVYMNLELFYRVAIELKKKQLKTSTDNINNISMYPIREESNIEHSNDTDARTLKRKTRFFSLFKK